tara:strand:+ start:871 stop:1350 length:480 start_codon:yes stop_codon:yes gene_type:complete
MKFIKLVWRIILNVKIIIITLFLLASLVLNVVLFIGGSLYSSINSGFEIITGVQTVSSKNQATIKKLGSDLLAAQQQKLKTKRKLVESIVQCDSEGGNERQLKARLTGISGQLAALRGARLALETRLESQNNRLVSEQEENQELKSRLMLCSSSEQNTD